MVLVAAVWLSALWDNELTGTDIDSISWAQFGALWVASFVAGYIVRRPSAVVLALLPILVAIPFGVQDPNSLDPAFSTRDRVVDLMAPIALICAAFLAAGIITAILIESIRSRRSVPAPG